MGSFCERYVTRGYGNFAQETTQKVPSIYVAFLASFFQSPHICTGLWDAVLGHLGPNEVPQARHPEP